MASLFTHAFVGAAAGLSAGPKALSKNRLILVATFCSMLPDVDVIGFRFGIHYGDLWGHRGMAHSLIFAAVIGMFCATFFMNSGVKWGIVALLLFLVTASHGALDAMTDGGVGVAFFSPFDKTRYFFPFRPLAVSPIGTHRFFSSRGLYILLTEIFWIWLPLIPLTWLTWSIRKPSR